MTDAEIKKALEKEINEYAAEDVGSPEYFKLITAILDLFNRKQAEIERLNGLVADGDKAFNKMTELYNKAFNRCRKAKAEAIKEFAERLKSRLIAVTYRNFDDTIDNLVKEMVGDAK